MKRLIIVLSALAGLGFGTQAMAQTIGYADAIKILSSSCGKDINTHCKNVNLGENRIGACLAQNASKISNQCKADSVRVYQLLELRYQAQQQVAQICDRDIQARCNLVKPGSGRVLRCLLKAQKTVSKTCNQAIDAAGYR